MVNAIKIEKNGGKKDFLVSKIDKQPVKIRQKPASSKISIGAATDKLAGLLPSLVWI